MTVDREVFGTAFQENGRWVLRYVTGQGAKVPILAGTDVKNKLLDSAMVRLTGYLSHDGNGSIVAVVASDAEVIARPGS